MKDQKQVEQSSQATGKKKQVQINWVIHLKEAKEVQEAKRKPSKSEIKISCIK